MKTVEVLLLTAPIDEALANKLLKRLRLGVAGVKIRPIGSYPLRKETLLTSRQTQVLRGIASGATAKEVASRLGISPKTVETHRAGIMERLGTRRIPELLRYAIQAGVISLAWVAKRHGPA